nr:RNA-directed DNA polymerase, eukaryota [Tanacetum cinerariifolium]
MWREVYIVPCLILGIAITPVIEIIFVIRSHNERVRRFFTLRAQGLEIYTEKAGGVKKDIRVNEVGNSYMHVVKGQMQPENKESKSTPALVLSDEFLLLKDLSKSLFGRVKQFASLANIRKADEMCFHSERLCIYTKSEKNIFEEFKIIFRGRAFWIRAKEAPGWVPDFMEENDDGGFNVHKSGSCGGDSDVEGVLETIFEESGQKENNLDEEHTDKQQNHLGDPFSIYKLLKKKKDNVEKENNSEHSMKYPSGFTPKDGTDVVGMHAEESRSDNIVNLSDHNAKEMLWDYLTYEIGKWKGEVVIMGDFNKVRYKSDRFGSVFNVQGANVLNSFITNAGLEEVPLGGSSFTWCHKSATKMSKLDRFLISENLLNTCPNITAITLERYLSDHQLILLRESHFDYGPTPFRFSHHWIEMEGFSKVVEDAWREGPCDESNEMINMMIKLKYLKTKIREWNKKNMLSAKNVKAKYKDELEALEAIIDKGDGNVEVVNKRLEVVNTLHKIDKKISSEMAQKANVKRSNERDGNTSFFHGMLNKKQSLFNIRGIIVDGLWIKSPHRVELESDVSNEEIKKAVWDCGIDKSLGLDGFTFGFYLRFWNLIKNDVYDAIKYFFTYGVIPKGCNSSFIVLIPKIPDAKTVNDFKPISLIGSLYKIIAKNLANCLVGVLGDIVNEVQSAFIAGRQILDGPFILNEVLQWFYTQNTSSWVRVIKAIHEDDGKVGGYVKDGAKSYWLSIVNQINSLKNKGINLLDLCMLNWGMVIKTAFWEDILIEGKALKNWYPHIYSLETCKLITVGMKLAQTSLDSSFRRVPRGGVEQEQFDEFINFGS